MTISSRWILFLYFYLLGFLNSVPLLKNLPTDKLARIADCLEVVGITRTLNFCANQRSYEIVFTISRLSRLYITIVCLSFKRLFEENIMHDSCWWICLWSICYMYISFRKLINEVILLSDNISRKYSSNVFEWFIDITSHYVYVTKLGRISAFKTVSSTSAKLFSFLDWTNS